METILQFQYHKFGCGVLVESGLMHSNEKYLLIYEINQLGEKRMEFQVYLRK